MKIIVETDMTEMPKECLFCDLCYDSCRCIVCGDRIPFGSRLEQCPLKETANEDFNKKDMDYERD